MAEFGGTIGRTFEDSTPWWPPLPTRARRARRTSSSCCSTTSATRSSAATAPTSPRRRFDRLAAARPALRELPHHRAVLAHPRLPADAAATTTPTAWPASSSWPPASPATTPRSRRRTASSPRSCAATGYATYAVGKWHLSPATEMATGSRRDTWPLGRGFERYYGFMGGETDQYRPDLVHDNHPVEPPRTPEEGYHLTEDLADHAIALPQGPAGRRARPSRSSSGSRPGACHAPHQAPTRLHRRLPRPVRPGLGRVARRRCSSASWRRACCRRAPSCPSGRAGCRRGTR